MSTRSAIGRLNADGTVHAIYCHFDGYPEGVGVKLARHYQDAAKVDQLIGLGDLSSLGSEIGEKHDFDWKSGYYHRDAYAETKNDPRNAMCRAYGRDRGERGTEAAHLPSLAEFLAWGADCAGGYIYLFTSDGWRLYSPYIEIGEPIVVEESYQRKDPWRVAPLADVLAAP